MSFEIAKDGSLSNPSKVVSSKGVCPCHLAVTEKDVYVVNYLSGNIVSTSSRGEDTIVSFKADADKLTLVSRTSVEGSFPRDFDFCDDYIICTNEKTDNITVFKTDCGELFKTDEIKDIKNPLCVNVY